MDKDFQEFMKKHKANDKEIEDELLKMMERDPEFKKLKGKKNPNEIDSIDCNNINLNK